jgi:lauroyl/myristoyl acyltransferase
MVKNKQRGNRLGFIIFDIYLSIGVKHAYALLYFVCIHYLLFDRTAVKSTAKYIKLRFPKCNFFKKYIHIYKIFINTGKNLVDLRLLEKKQEQLQFQCNNQPIIECLKNKNGLLMLSSHTGNWQIMMRKLPDFNVKKNIVMRLHNHPEIDEFFKLEKGELFNINIIDADKGLEASIEILQELSNGNLVSIMADRTISSSQNIQVDFFNKKIEIPKGPFLIAASSKADIIQLIPFRINAASYKIKTYIISIPTGLNKKMKINYISQKYTDNIEKFLSEHPYEWNATSLL